MVQLSDRNDVISIGGSTIDYPLFVWARVVGLGENASGGGRIDATASTIRSTDPKTEGIQLVVSDRDGVGNFVDLNLEAPRLSPESNPNAREIVLLAGECRTERVQGYTGICDPEDAASVPQQ